jgi:nitrogen fixation-related uncharacterized protein
MNDQPQATAQRKQTMITVIFALVILIPSLWGFATKFFEFVALFRREVDGTFAISPILNYLLASLGFFCLFCWGIGHGMFRDLEQPKKAMLETERMLDENSRASSSVTEEGTSRHARS